MPSKTNERAEYGSLTPSIKLLKPQLKGYATRLKNDLRESVGENYTKYCPKCQRTRLIKFFGIRIQTEPGTGIPKRAIWQSYCQECRSKPAAGAPAKKKTGKKAVAKKVTEKVKAGEAKVVAPPEAVAAAETPVPAPVIETGAVVAAGMELLRDEGVIQAQAVDEFETAPSTAHTFQETVGAALDKLKDEPAETSEAVETAPEGEPQEFPAPTEEELTRPVDELKEMAEAEVETPAGLEAPAPAPILGADEYLTACGEVLPKGAFCSCKTCKAARGQ